MSNPAGPQTPQTAQTGARGVRRVDLGTVDCDPGRWPLLVGHREGLGRGSPLPEGLGQGQWVAMERVLESCRIEPQAYSRSSPVYPLA